MDQHPGAYPLLRLPVDPEFIKEWGLYVRAPTPGITTPPQLQQFWAKHVGRLSCLATFYCNFPASSASAERTFSAAGHVDTPVRNRLSDTNRSIAYQLKFNGDLERRLR